MIKLIGIPFDENSSYLRGSSKAPEVIRTVLHNGSSNYYSENGTNMELHLEDAGNVDLKVQSVVSYIQEHVTSADRIIFLGGDHSVSFPIAEAMTGRYGKLNIVHFDAHADLYDNFQDNPFSHASPFARIMENNLAKRLVQVGIRTLNQHQREQAKRFNVELIEMNGFDRSVKLKFDGPVYISLDLDAFDPAYAPGVSHPEPGGLSIRDVLTVIHNIEGTVIGCDIVELNPDRDINNLTAYVAAKFVKEIGSKMVKA